MYAESVERASRQADAFSANKDAINLNGGVGKLFNNNHHNGVVHFDEHSIADGSVAGDRTISTTSKQNVGVYLDDGESTVDFVLAYVDGQSEQLDRQRNFYVRNLQRHGLMIEIDTHLSEEQSTSKLMFMKVHARWNTLCRVAELLRMKLPLRNAEPLEENTSLDHGLPVFKKLATFNDDEQMLIGTDIRPVTAQFTRATADQFLIDNKDAFFTQTQKIRIVYDVLQHAKCDPDNPKKRGLQWLLKREVFLAAYPTHDGITDWSNLNIKNPQEWSQRQLLRYVWADFKRALMPQPLHLIKLYFGDKVGVYFAWLGFYTQMLIWPSLFGITCFLYGIFTLPNSPIQSEICDGGSSPGNMTMCPVCRIPNCDPWQMSTSCESAKWNYRFDHTGNVFMAFATLVWAIIFNKMWKRKEEDLVNKWDGEDIELDDLGMRPEYETRTKVVRISPVTRQEEAYIPTSKRLLWMVQSFSSLMVIILLVVAGLVALIVVRIVLYGILKSFGGIWFQMQFDFASLAIHVLTFIVVMTLGYIYEKAARRLTELECPRTESDYLISYVWKVFIFELLNNFAPIFYASFVRGKNLNNPSEQSWLQEMCDPGGCLNEVVQAVGILLLARLLISNAAELGVPVLKSLWNNTRLGNAMMHSDKEDSEARRHAPQWQRDYTLNETDLDGVYMEYLETMVQFGYVVLFVAAFPLAPFICFINNIVEIRLDAINFVTAYRRPMPARATGEKIWQRCLSIIIKLGIVTNAGFLAFTSEVIPQLVYKYKYAADTTRRGFVEWSLSKFNTSSWEEFGEMYPGISHCYYRNFIKLAEDNSNEPCSTVWADIMLARLLFFIVFVLSLYFFSWLVDFLVPNTPSITNIRTERSKYLAKRALHKNNAAAGIAANPAVFFRSHVIRDLQKRISTIDDDKKKSPAKRSKAVPNGGLRNHSKTTTPFNHGSKTLIELTPETLL